MQSGVFAKSIEISIVFNGRAEMYCEFCLRRAWAPEGVYLWAGVNKFIGCVKCRQGAHIKVELEHDFRLTYPIVIGQILPSIVVIFRRRSASALLNAGSGGSWQKIDAQIVM